MYQKRKGGSSPWGKIDDVTNWAEGIQFVSTSSHGGFFLSAERYQELVKRIGEVNLWLGNGHQDGGHWFEEDCDAQHVVKAFPEIFESKERA